MSARDRAICRWFAHLEAKAFFIPEGHYNIFSGTATLLGSCRLAFPKAFVTFLSDRTDFPSDIVCFLFSNKS